MFPGDIPRQVFAQWLFNAITCSLEPFMAMTASYIHRENCETCEYDCEEWDAALAHRYIQEFEFNLSDDHWTAVAVEPNTTTWVTSEGFQPINTTGNNRACIAIFTDTVFFQAEQIEIGLGAPYPVDVKITIQIYHEATGLPEEISENSLAGTDYWTFPLTPGVNYEKIEVLVEVDDGSPCDEIQAIVPTIRYVTVHGIGINPWA